MMKTEIRILLIDDHVMVTDSIAERLQREIDFQVVGRAATADAALSLAAEQKPDVILMDIDLRDMYSFEIARRLSQMLPGARIIFVSAFMQDSFIGQALEARAHGYLIKQEPIECLIRAIREVHSGGAYFSEEVQSRIVVESTGAHLREAGRSRLSLLSPREREMLAYIARAFGKKKIAAMTELSIKTVDHHVTRLMKKLDIHDRVELARFAISEGIINAT